MHVVENKSKHGKKIYSSVLLRESYRENGKVKKRTIANISHCSKEEIEAIKLALKHKGDLSKLANVKKDVKLEQGLSVGAVYVLYEIAKRLGIEKALGRGFESKLGLWQVISRVLCEGSRLSSVRLARHHAVLEILGFNRGFDENDLYENLGWVSEKQRDIETKLLEHRGKKGKVKLYLYDVTSSYLEGDKNYFAEYGYNRDGKKGKKQIVIGMLCDEEGIPVSVEVFKGNTSDMKTFDNQVKKVAERFGCKEVVFVGDRGMIKRAQIENLPENFYYITALTKAQIKSLTLKGVVQLCVFDEDVCEIIEGSVRYILRRNPIRQEEIRENRLDKLNYIKSKIAERNTYLREHPRARVDVAVRKVEELIKKLRIDKWARIEFRGRELYLEIEEEKLRAEEELDGCYVLETNVPSEVADKNVIHARYKDLSLVEQVFRSSKGLLNIRPVFVRTEKNTRGHVFIVMLSYLLIKYLQEAWKGLDITVSEGIYLLSQVCSIKVVVNNRGHCFKVPEPEGEVRRLLEAVSVKLPSVLPPRKYPVDTRKKLKK